MYTIQLLYNAYRSAGIVLRGNKLTALLFCVPFLTGKIVTSVPPVCLKLSAQQN